MGLKNYRYISTQVNNKQYKLTDEDKKFLQDLFLEYKINGMKPKEALEKAKTVLTNFKKQ